MRTLLGILVLALTAFLWVRAPNAPNEAGPAKTLPSVTPPVTKTSPVAKPLPKTNPNPNPNLNATPSRGRVHYQAEWPYGPANEGLNDARRNLWEELESFIVDAKLTAEERERFLDDLALAATATTTAIAEKPKTLAAQDEEIEATLGYLSDAQWALLTHRFSHPGILVWQLSINHVLTRESNATEKEGS